MTPIEHMSDRDLLVEVYTLVKIASEDIEQMRYEAEALGNRVTTLEEKTSTNRKWLTGLSALILPVSAMAKFFGN